MTTDSEQLLRRHVIIAYPSCRIMMSEVIIITLLLFLGQNACIFNFNKILKILSSTYENFCLLRLNIMAGTKKINNKGEKGGDKAKNIRFDEIEDDDSAKLKRQRIATPKKSPKKSQRKKKQINCREEFLEERNFTRARFLEDGNEVDLEVEIHARDENQFEEQERMLGERDHDQQETFYNEQENRNSSTEEGEASDDEEDVTFRRNSSAPGADRSQMNASEVNSVAMQQNNNASAVRPTMISLADVEEKIDSVVSKLSNTLSKFMDSMSTANKANKNKETDDSKGNNKNDSVKGSNSEVTIYDHAINKDTTETGTVNNNENTKKKRDSSSSEELIDTSDEFLEDPTSIAMQIDKNLSIFADRACEQQKRGNEGREREDSRRRDPFNDREPRPGTSRQETQQRDRHRSGAHTSTESRERTPEEIAHDQADQMIRQAEASTAQIYDVSGNLNNTYEQENKGNSSIDAQMFTQNGTNARGRMLPR